MVGFCCIVCPELVTQNAQVIAGIVLIVYGSIKLMGYFSKDLYCLAFQYDFACGIFLAVLGIVVLAGMSKYFGTHLMADMGILIFLDSLLSVQTSMDARSFGLSSWKFILFLSLLAGIFGLILLIRNNVFSAGCALIVEGVMRHFVVHCTVQLSDMCS